MDFKKRFRSLFRSGPSKEFEGDRVRIRRIKSSPGSWLDENLPAPRLALPPLGQGELIESAARRTEDLGAMPLWAGYSELRDYPYAVGSGAQRTSEQVRTSRQLGGFFAWLVTKRRPTTIVEFGTAFGVSGMYFLAGIEQVGNGVLYTFEPNEVWAEVARRNLDEVSPRFVLTVGTFEAHVDRVLDASKTIDLALVDAIHTGDFVDAQFALIKERLSPSGLVLFDDISFSDDMRRCWNKIAEAGDVRASVEVQGIGLVEMDARG